MIALPLADVATAVGAAPLDDRTPVTAVAVDSRQVRPGTLFVALPGERTDGHHHVAAAVEAGAVAVLVAREVEAAVPALLVNDPLVALQALARTTWSAGGAPLTIGVTGSSGKTSTKDLLGQVLGGIASTLAPEGSLNNELGLPLTLLRRDETTRFAALEYSARGIGHIAFLCGLARPDHAVVLNVGLRAESIEVGADGRARFRLVADQGSADVALRVVGEHQVSNALAVAAAVLTSGASDDLALVADLLSTAEPLSRWRMEVRERADGVTVVNDAYNANPESMRAALRSLAIMSEGKQRRTVAVLGPMGELGAAAEQAHLDLGRYAVRLDLGRLVVVGAAAGGIYAGAVLEGSWGDESVHVDDVEAAVALLREDLRPGDVVLVKASRAAGLERVAAALLEDA